MHIDFVKFSVKLVCTHSQVGMWAGNKSREKLTQFTAEKSSNATDFLL